MADIVLAVLLIITAAFVVLMLAATVCLVFDIFSDGLVSEKIQDLLERRE